MSVILYDIASNGRCRCWSPNTWRSRTALNFKGIDYKTEWLEYPDIEPKLKSLGIAPNENDLADYTCPVTSFPNGTILMQSRAIAEELEKQFPNTPSLHLDAPVLKEVEDTLANLFDGLRPVIIPRAPRLLNPPSEEYFQRTRAIRYGMSLAEYEQSEKGGENAWKAAEPGFRKFADLLKQDSSGPFFLGNTPSYADLLFLSTLQFVKETGQDVFDRALSHDGAFAALYKAGQPWLERDYR